MEWPVDDAKTPGLERECAVPLHPADGGTMAAPIGPIVADSDAPPSPGALSEPRVRKNLFPAGPISPIVDHLDAENCRMGPSTPDPHNHPGLRARPSP